MTAGTGQDTCLTHNCIGEERRHLRPIAHVTGAAVLAQIGHSGGSLVETMHEAPSRRQHVGLSVHVSVCVSEGSTSTQADSGPVSWLSAHKETLRVRRTTTQPSFLMPITGAAQQPIPTHAHTEPTSPASSHP